MTAIDMMMPASALERYRRLYPGAIGYGVAKGSKWQLTRELKLMERRKEIIAIRRFMREPRPGWIEVPYVRLRTRREVILRRTLWIAVGIVAAAGALSALLWMAWTARHALLTIGGLTLLSGLLVMGFGSHWTRGCTGIHCSGCKG